MTEQDEKPGRKTPNLRLVLKALASQREAATRAEDQAYSAGLASAIDRLVGSQILRLRNELGMTRKTLGNAVGVSPEAIESYEDGRRRVGPKTLVDLAHVFHCEPSTFFRPIVESAGAEAAKIRDAYIAAESGKIDAESIKGIVIDVIDKAYRLLVTFEKLTNGGALEKK